MVVPQITRATRRASEYIFSFSPALLMSPPVNVRDAGASASILKSPDGDSIRVSRASLGEHRSRTTSVWESYYQSCIESRNAIDSHSPRIRVQGNCIDAAPLFFLPNLCICNLCSVRFRNRD